MSLHVSILKDAPVSLIAKFLPGSLQQRYVCINVSANSYIHIFYMIYIQVAVVLIATLCIFEIKIATGSTGLIKNFQEVRKSTGKGDRSEQVTSDFLLMSISYCKSHELEETC